MKGLLRRRNGSITVEASIVIPLVLFGILAVVYISLLLYQETRLQSIAIEACNKGASVWHNPEGSLETGLITKADLDEEDLYWRLWDGKKEEKLEAIRKYVIFRLKEEPYLPLGDTHVEVNLTDSIIQKKLTVNIHRVYRFPGAYYLKRFGVSGEAIITLKAEASIHEPVELIRNTDFALDIERELEDKFPQLKNIREKVGEVLKGICDKADGLFGERR